MAENRGSQPTALYPNPRNNGVHNNEVRLYMIYLPYMTYYEKLASNSRLGCLFQLANDASSCTPVAKFELNEDKQ